MQTETSDTVDANTASPEPSQSHQPNNLPSSPASHYQPKEAPKSSPKVMLKHSNEGGAPLSENHSRTQSNIRIVLDNQARQRANNRYAAGEISSSSTSPSHTKQTSSIVAADVIEEDDEDHAEYLTKKKKQTEKAFSPITINTIPETVESIDVSQIQEEHQLGTRPRSLSYKKPNLRIQIPRRTVSQAPPAIMIPHGAEILSHHEDQHQHDGELACVYHPYFVQAIARCKKCSCPICRNCAVLKSNSRMKQGRPKQQRPQDENTVEPSNSQIETDQLHKQQDRDAAGATTHQIQVVVDDQQQQHHQNVDNELESNIQHEDDVFYCKTCNSERKLLRKCDVAFVVKITCGILFFVLIAVVISYIVVAMAIQH